MRTTYVEKAGREAREARDAEAYYESVGDWSSASYARQVAEAAERAEEYLLRLR